MTGITAEVPDTHSLKANCDDTEENERSVMLKRGCNINSDDDDDDTVRNGRSAISKRGFHDDNCADDTDDNERTVMIYKPRCNVSNSNTLGDEICNADYDETDTVFTTR